MHANTSLYWMVTRMITIRPKDGHVYPSKHQDCIIGPLQKGPHEGFAWQSLESNLHHMMIINLTL